MKILNCFLTLCALMLSFVPHMAKCGEVVFSFDDTHVTVTDNNRVYRFPTKVFQSQFGMKESGKTIVIPKQYKGFQVEASDVVAFAVDGLPRNSVFYYGLVYNNYYGRAFSTTQNEHTYAWTVPDQSPLQTTRSPSSIDQTLSLTGETDNIYAKQSEGKIQYFDKSQKLLWVSDIR